MYKIENPKTYQNFWKISSEGFSHLGIRIYKLKIKILLLVYSVKSLKTYKIVLCGLRNPVTRFKKKMQKYVSMLLKELRIAILYW